MDELLGVVASVVGALTLAGWIALIVWSAAIGRRHPEGSRWRKLWLVPATSLALQVLAIPATAALVWLAFLGDASIDTPAEERATALARGISEALNVGAFAMVGSFVLLVPAIALAIVGHRRGSTPRAARSV